MVQGGVTGIPTGSTEVDDELGRHAVIQADRRDLIWLLGCERLVCAAFVAWLQLVGLVTHTVLHHLVQAVPIVLLLFLCPSPSRHFTGVLAGFAWVFMLAIVTPMLHDAIILGYAITHPEEPTMWLAPVAALVAAAWAAFNLAALAQRPRFLLPTGLVGIGLIVVLAWIQPYITVAFEVPLTRTLAGQYAWALVLLLEAPVVLVLPAWYLFRLNPALRLCPSFVALQTAYWIFFVAAVVAGLLPVFNR